MIQVPESVLQEVIVFCDGVIRCNPGSLLATQAQNLLVQLNRLQRNSEIVPSFEVSAFLGGLTGALIGSALPKSTRERLLKGPAVACTCGSTVEFMHSTTCPRWVKPPALSKRRKKGDK